MVIIIAGANLSKYGDIIADKSGLGRAWVGLILLASITSMPELITGVSSVALVGEVDLGFGEIMGSCVFNLAILALMDPMNGKVSIFSEAGKGHVLSAAFSVLLIGIAAISIETSGFVPSFWHISFSTPIIFIVYIVGMRTLYKYEKSVINEFVSEVAVELEAKGIGLKRALVMFSINAGVVIVAAIFLPYIAEHIAELTGLGSTFVGSTFIALATSLPEVVISIAALRLGAIDMAIANMFGSNMFNILVLGVEDIFYTHGPIFAVVSKNHTVTGVISIAMASIAVIALTYRQTKSALLRFGWGTFTILIIGLFNFFVLYMLR